MRWGIRITTVAGAFFLALGLAAPSSSAQSYNPSDESKVHSLTNGTRSALGLRQLVRNDELVGMARRQADRMEAKGDIFHNTNLGGEISSIGINWARVGENVGMGPTVDLIYAALLKSPSHYQNIVKGEYNSLGLGVVNGDDGKKYLVQVFANVNGASAPAPVQAAPAAAPAAPAPQAQAAPAPVEVAPAPAQTPSRIVSTPEAAPKTADPNALTGGFVAEFRLPPL